MYQIPSQGILVHTFTFDLREAGFCIVAAAGLGIKNSGGMAQPGQKRLQKLALICKPTLLEVCLSFVSQCTKVHPRCRCSQKIHKPPGNLTYPTWEHSEKLIFFKSDFGWHGISTDPPEIGRSPAVVQKLFKSPTPFLLQPSFPLHPPPGWHVQQTIWGSTGNHPRNYPMKKRIEW